MKAIRLHEFGPPENLLYEEVDDLHPDAGHVRIAVAAAGVHVIDTTLRANARRGPYPAPELPTIPGREVAGVVDKIGDGVDQAWLGSSIVVHLGMVPGGYASQAVAAASTLHRLADGVDPAEAVAMIGTGRTTMAILDVVEITASDVVVVPAAAGGIGNVLVQVARDLGATVVGLAGGQQKVRIVEQLGATIAADYTEPGWTARVVEELGPRSVTVAVDGVGGELGRAVFELVGAGGRFVMFGWALGQEPTQITSGDLFARGVTVTAAVGARIQQRPGGVREFEDRALELLAAGSVRPLVQRFALSDAASAHRALEDRATVGKVVLVPAT